MTELLLSIFVQNYKKTNDPEVRSAIGKMAGIVGIICNFLLSLGKLSVGMVTSSVSIMADALNNLSDCIASLITLLGFRMAQRPADQEHPYGHARIEYITGMIISILVLMMGIELIKSSVDKIVHPMELQLETTAFLILLLSIGLKFWMYLFNRSLGKRIGSASLYATAADSRNDAIATMAVLAGCIVNHIWKINIDGYVGLLVALFILYSGIGIAKETAAPLLGNQADEKLVRQISELILSHDKILGIHDLLLHDYGPGKCYASVHAELNAEEDPLVCHDIIDDIECDVADQFNIQLVIHYDPVVLNDREWNQRKEEVTAVIQEIDPTFSLHDFRLVKGAEQTKIVFDLQVPYSMSGQYRSLKEQIDRKLKERGVLYPTMIRFENKKDNLFT